MTQQPIIHRSPWPHRLALLLACATFPLIWVGGLVTTYDAGMAVPDWPDTFGRNLFLYPWEWWIAGPWDLFIEHGHRLLGAIVGLLAIAFLLISFRCDERKWLRGLAIAALVLVVLQGVLGGQRVLLDDRRIAQIHGCVGPLFFSLTVVLAAVTSRWWRQVAARAGSALTLAHHNDMSQSGGKSRTSDGPNRMRHATNRKWITLAISSAIIFVTATMQLILGSQLRHGIEYASPSLFRAAVTFHVVIAMLLVVQIVWSGFRVFRTACGSGLRVPAAILFVLIACQFVLGVGTWAVKYGWPVIFHNWLPAPAFTVQAESMSQSLIVTGHVAIGSLILATSGLQCLMACRWAWLSRSGTLAETPMPNILQRATTA